MRGSRTCSAYWVEPSLAIPRNLIPVVRGRARQFEAIRAREWGGGALDQSLVSRLARQSFTRPAVCCNDREPDTGRPDLRWIDTRYLPRIDERTRRRRHALVGRNACAQCRAIARPRIRSQATGSRTADSTRSSLPPAGGPTHFLKVRPLRHVGFAREALSLCGCRRSRTSLRSFRALARSSRGSARILALEFIEGVALDVLIRSRRARAWHELAADVLRSTVPLREAIGELSAMGHTPIASQGSQCARTSICSHRSASMP